MLEDFIGEESRRVPADRGGRGKMKMPGPPAQQQVSHDRAERILMNAIM